MLALLAFLFQIGLMTHIEKQMVFMRELQNFCNRMQGELELSDHDVIGGLNIQGKIMFQDVYQEAFLNHVDTEVEEIIEPDEDHGFELDEDY